MYRFAKQQILAKIQSKCLLLAILHNYIYNSTNGFDIRVIPCQMSNFFTKLHHMFGAVVHLNEKNKNAKKSLKNSNYLQSYDHFKKRIFARSASLHTFKTF